MSFARFCLVVLVAQSGCSSDEGGTNEGATAVADAGAEAGDQDGAATACGSSCDVDGGEAGPSVVPPVLSLLAANQAGRFGDDLLLSVQGKDVNKLSYGLRIKLRDKDGNPVRAFRNWTGTPTESERIVLFDGASAAGLATFNRTVRLAGFAKAYPEIASVIAQVTNPIAFSAEVTADVQLQTEQILGQSCDPAVVTSRCSPGLSCAGTSKKCVTPAAPSLDKFSYFTSPVGGRMLFAGSDAADDLESIHLEFMDAQSQPVLIDLTGNGDLSSTFDLSTPGISNLGLFFDAVQSTPDFDTTVLTLAATPSGKNTGAGTRIVATLQAPVIAAAGGACDARGFVQCDTGYACIRGATGTSTCVARAQALNDATKASPHLSTAANFVTGYAEGVPLWGDPPSDCVPSGVKGLPAGMVWMRLTIAMPTLTLSSDHEETTGRTAIYVLRGVGAKMSGAPIGCQSGLPASLTMTNVPAGDYTVVIGASSTDGAHFGLSLE